MRRIDAGRWGRLMRDSVAVSWSGVVRLALAACLLHSAPCAAQSAATSHLRIVGGLAGVNQYTRFEEPFWTRELARLSGGRATAEIVPFDRAGIRGQEMLRLVQLGVVPFGTALLNLSSIDDAELAMPDMAGLNPDMAALRRSVGAFRPYLKKVLRERYGSELLAIYAYPAQVTFCTRPVASLADLSGRRIRVSSATQSDWVTALGAIPVQTAFAEVVANLRSGNIDCAITGTMSGNAIGLHEVTSASADDAGQLGRRRLRRQRRGLGRLAERRPGAAAARAAEARAGDLERRRGRDPRRDRLQHRRGLVRRRPQGPHDRSASERRRRRPQPRNSGQQRPAAWLKRCGPHCAQLWKQVVAPATGVELP